MAEIALATAVIAQLGASTVSAVQARSAAKRGIRRSRQLETAQAEADRLAGLGADIPKELPQVTDPAIAERVRERRTLAQLQARRGRKGTILTGALGAPDFGVGVQRKILLGG